MDSNLPPGCTEGMIPGNTPEDRRQEAQLEYVENLVNEHLSPTEINAMGDERYSALCDSICNALDVASSQGYADGLADATMAHQHELDNKSTTGDQDEPIRQD